MDIVDMNRLSIDWLFWCLLSYLDFILVRYLIMSRRRPVDSTAPVYYVVCIMDTQDSACFCLFAQKRMVPTRYVQLDVLRQLCIYDDVACMFPNIGWTPILEAS